jgi:hypothetical protein
MPSMSVLSWRMLQWLSAITGNFSLQLQEESLEKDTLKEASTMYRFYTFRASILKTPEIVPILRKLLRYPWLYNITVLKAYPELADDIIETLKSTDSKYLKFVMIWALSELKSAGATTVLQDILFDPQSRPLFIG